MAMAAVACPVARSEAAIDLLYVMLPPSYGSGEWLALVNLAVRQYQQAESAWAARKQSESIAVMERELARAKKSRCASPTDPHFEGLDGRHRFTPAAQRSAAITSTRSSNVRGRTLLAIAVAKTPQHSCLAPHPMVHAGVLGSARLCTI